MQTMRYSDVKAAFARWAENGAELNEKRLRVNGAALPLWEVQHLLRRSEDVMPTGACDGLNIEPGSTYSDGVIAAAEKADDELAAMFGKDGPFGRALRAIGDESGPRAIAAAADALAEGLLSAVVDYVAADGNGRSGITVESLEKWPRLGTRSDGVTQRASNTASDSLQVDGAVGHRGRRRKVNGHHGSDVRRREPIRRSERNRRARLLR